MGLKFVAVAFIARRIGVVEIGIFNLILTFTTLFSLVFTFGTHRSIIYYKSRSGKSSSEVLVSYQLLTIIFVVFTFLFIIGLYPYFYKYIGFEDSSLSMLVALCTVSHIIFLSVKQTILGDGNYKRYFIITVAVHLVFLLFVLLSLGQLNLKIAIIAFYLPFALSISLFIINFVWNIKRLRKPQFVLKMMRLQTKYGLRSYAYDVSNILTSRVDYIFVSALLNAYWLGQYSLAKMLSEGMLQFAKALYNVIFQYASRGKNETGNKTSFFRFVSYILIGMIVICIPFADYMIAIFFGNEFLDALATLKILIVSIYFLSMCILLTGNLFGSGNPSASSKTGLMNCVYFSAATYLSLQIFNSIEAVAWGVLVANILYFAHLIIVSMNQNAISRPIFRNFI